MTQLLYLPLQCFPVTIGGAKDNIVEGDKAAGSYDKIMITDVCISLSRQRKDKVEGTGRFHIMKNRYGMDGLTFGVKADTSTGHFEVSNELYQEGEEDNDNTSTPQTKSFSGIDKFDRSELQKKFFELNT